MKFYELDSALQEAIHAADKPVRLKIEIAFAGYFESVFEQDILEVAFYGLKEKAGGTTARGEVLLDNAQGIYAYTGAGPGTRVKVSFSVGEGLPYFQRFNFFIDDKGIQDIRGPGRKRYARIGLLDLSAKLKKSDESRDWNAPAVFAYGVVCDKAQTEKSIVHGIAARAGITAKDIDCSTIPVTLPFVQITKSVWAELSGLARAYRCHLECAVEKPLVFAHSPYQEGNLHPIGPVEEQTEARENIDTPYTLTGENIFYFRKTARADYYRNTVRLKINLPVSLERQEIWRYDDPPVVYDEYLQAHYPFKYPLTREIETGAYEAFYKVIDAGAKERTVLYADEIDTQEEAENRLDYDGGSFSYSLYDVTTYHDKAILTLRKEADGDVYKAAIYGRPIVLDLNRSCFVRDTEGVAAHGTAALNVTGTYFSDFEIDGKPHYEDWTRRELEERKIPKKEFTVKTHRGVFNARVGAKVKIVLKNEELQGMIHAFSFLYKCGEPFIATLKILEI
jgi:hypothetical protein